MACIDAYKLCTLHGRQIVKVASKLYFNEIEGQLFIAALDLYQLSIFFIDIQTSSKRDLIF